MDRLDRAVRLEKDSEPEEQPAEYWLAPFIQQRKKQVTEELSAFMPGNGKIEPEVPPTREELRMRLFVAKLNFATRMLRVGHDHWWWQGYIRGLKHAIEPSRGDTMEHARFIVMSYCNLSMSHRRLGEGYRNGFKALDRCFQRL